MSTRGSGSGCRYEAPKEQDASFDYWLLEEVIERASGMPFEAFLRRELFEPAGMPFTGAALTKWDRGNVARYTLWTLPDSVLPGEASFTDPLARPPAWRVLLSTADDLHRWYPASATSAAPRPAAPGLMTTTMI